MATNDELQNKIDHARDKHRRAKQRYEASGDQVARFDMGYWLGLAHAYELVLENEHLDPEGAY